MNNVHPSPNSSQGRSRGRSKEASKGSSKGLLRETRGAVYVEFLIAFLPVFVFFLCMIQLSLLFSAKLMVEHAAVIGARAAAVVFGDAPSVYGESAAETNVMTKKRRQTVYDAVVLSLAPLILDGSLVSLNVLFPEATKPDGKDQPEGTRIDAMNLGGTHMTRVRVEAKVVCKIALADAIACSGFGNYLRDAAGFARLANVRAESIFPYQGASYVYEER